MKTIEQVLDYLKEEIVYAKEDLLLIDAGAYCRDPMEPEIEIKTIDEIESYIIILEDLIKFIEE